MFEDLSDGARQVAHLAQEHARALNHNYVGTEHVLAALVHLNGVAQRALARHQVDLGPVIDLIEDMVGRGLKKPEGDILFAPRAKRSLELGERESRTLGHRHVGTEHILLGLIKEDNGVALTLLERLGVSIPALRDTVLELSARGDSAQATPRWPRSRAAARKIRPVASPTSTEMPPAPVPLAEVARELVPDQAAVGRGKEALRVLQVLSRTSRNNPVLVGRAGTGKTAVVHAAATASTAGECGPAMRGRRMEVLPPLDGGSLDRFRAVVNALDGKPGPVLFVEQITELTDGVVSDVLTAAVVRGALRVVTTATPEQYADALSRHEVLTRLCQPVRVEPMSADDTVAVLLALRGRFATHHGLSISTDALAATVDLAGRHVHTSSLPGAAIDLFDEVCSRTSAADGELGPAHVVRVMEELLTEWAEPTPVSSGPVGPGARQIASTVSTSVGPVESPRLFDGGPDIWMIC